MQPTCRTTAASTLPSSLRLWALPEPGQAVATVSVQHGMMMGLVQAQRRHHHRHRDARRLEQRRALTMVVVVVVLVTWAWALALASTRFANDPFTLDR